MTNRNPEPSEAGRVFPEETGDWTEADSWEEAHEPPASVRSMTGAWPGRETELLERFGVFIDYLLARNQRVNLTGDRTPELQWAAHVGDALPVAALIERALGGPPVGRRVLDVGSGGGIPGLIWALLWPRAEVTLLEATGKKANFLEAATDLLGLVNVHVLNGRAEQLGREPEYRETWDIVTARAVAALPVLAEWTLPFLRVGGTFFALKGPEVAPEIQAARSAFGKLGAEGEPDILPYTRADGRRCHLLVYRKTAPTPEGYPRKAGKARRRPI